MHWYDFIFLASAYGGGWPAPLSVSVFSHSLSLSLSLSLNRLPPDFIFLASAYRGGGQSPLCVSFSVSLSLSRCLSPSDLPITVSTISVLTMYCPLLTICSRFLLHMSCGAHIMWSRNLEQILLWWIFEPRSIAY